jgi:2-(3-amino-3-carboxypropyl)histidine synthase
MRSVRRRFIERARSARKWALVLGTLGRQGNPHILTMLQECLAARGLECVSMLMSEISPTRLAMIQDVDAFVQVSVGREGRGGRRGGGGGVFPRCPRA